MINNGIMNKDPYVVPDQALLIILDSKSAVCMANNGNNTKHIRQIYRIIKLLRNGEEFNLHKKVWCEGCIQLSEIGTKDVVEYGLNPRLGYTMAILENGRTHLYKRGNRNTGNSEEQDVLTD